MEAKATLEKHEPPLKYNDILIILIIIKQSQMLWMKIENMVVDFMYEPITYMTI